MVHLRIVAPPELSEDVLRVFSETPSVTNVVVVPGAGREPAGDLVLADVAREDASVVLGDLKRMGLDRRGTIALETVDTSISHAAEQAEAAASGSPADAVVWEQLSAQTSEESAPSRTFMVFLVLAVLLAGIGLIEDSAVLVVGAMVVGPDFGPIAGTCIALVQGRGRIALQSFAALAIGFPLAIAVAIVVALLGRWTGLGPDAFDPSAETISATIVDPNGYAVLVGLLAGTAGMLSLSTAKSSALIGVVISVTTVPAAAAVALSLTYGHPDDALGALTTLLLNLTAMHVGGSLTLALQRVSYRRRRRRHREATEQRERARGGAYARPRLRP